MDFGFDAADEEFRAQARRWLEERLGPGGAFADLRGVKSPEDPDRRRAWERELGAGGWIGLGWPDDSMTRQVVWFEEYARAEAPDPLGIVGEQLLAPTLLVHGTAAQRARYLPGIADGTQIWCQGYSEPDAGSDLGGVRTRAEPAPDGWGHPRPEAGGGWLVTGQKTWTSLSQWADWCFVLARTEPGARRHAGLSLLLVPMAQEAGRIEVRPIRQLNGVSEFSEVFFDRARAVDVVGAVGDGWRVAMTLLSFERGAGMLGRQIGYRRELDAVLRAAANSGADRDPVLREELTRQWADLWVMRANALRTLGRAEPGTAAVAKLVWGNWHQRLGELAVRVRGLPGAFAEGRAHDPEQYPLTPAQHTLLFSRADTIYGGSDQIQRDIIAERVLGLPRRPISE
jgi:alkylation response protein AidB-like acyl-CoA dehydrogenase